jgi:hypothetical protein
LENVNITDLEAWCNIDFGNTTANPLSYAKHLYLCDAEVTNLEIPTSVTEIKFTSFNGYKGLSSVTIPKSVISIGKSAFYGCSGLSSITFEDGEDELEIDENAFHSVTPTKAYFGRQIDFSIIDCTALDSIEFGEYINSIASEAFQECASIRDVTSRNPVPPITDDTDTFHEYTYLYGVLYVPEASIELYQAANGWKNFYKIEGIKGDSSGISEIGNDDETAQISINSGAINVSCKNSMIRIVALNGTTVYSGFGNCNVNVAPGIYVAIVGNTAHKVAVM